MSLAPGTRVGAYEILSALGAGGMGEVCKARDTRLDRTVAIKILPDTLAADPHRAVPRRSVVRALTALVLLTVARAMPTTAQESPAPLTTAVAIRALSRQDVAHERAVRLHGVVMAIDTPRRAIFLHDGGAGIMVIVSDPAAVRSGDEVDVTGVTANGGLAPAVSARSVTVTGRGALPSPTRVTMTKLASGVLDNQWVEIDAIVRTFSIEGNDGVAELSIDGSPFSLRIAGPPATLGDVRVNAALRLRAVAVADLGNNGRPIGVRLLSPGRAALDVLDAGTADPFTLPIQAIQSLSDFNAQQAFGRLVHVRGATELQRPGTSLFVRDASGSIYASSRDALRLTIGDLVDVVGFLSNEDGPTLERATYRVVAHGPPPEPRVVDVSHIRGGQVSDELIRLNARVVSVSSDSLFLEADGLPFAATLDDSGFEQLRLVPQTDLRVTGIGIVTLRDGKVKTFKMRLRSLADVDRIRRPWWGSLERVLAALAAAGVLVALLIGWNVTLARTVRTQTDLIRSRIEHEAALTARHRDETRDAEQRTRFALDAARAGVWDVDVTTGQNRWSETVEALHGLRPGTFKGTTAAFLECIHPDDRPRIRAALRDPTDTLTEGNLEYRAVWPDGTERWINTVGRLWQTESGERRAGGVAIDITAKRRLEEQLRQSQKMEAIGQLAGGIAHDFNNLLTVIVGNAELLAKALPVGGEAQAMLQDIHKAGRRGASLTRQLLAYGRRQRLEPRVLSLNAVVQDVLSLVSRLLPVAVAVHVDLAEDLPAVYADPNQLDEVIMNLVVNARDAMPTGGRLGIATATVDLKDQARRPNLTPGAYVRLTISDTGTGMDDATVARAFEPFFTTKPFGKGTGLGLSSAYGIVKQTGGDLWVDTELGVGTAFTVLLPAARPDCH